MAKYSALLQRTASATLSVGSLTAAASNPRRFRLFHLILGSEATPADVAFLWQAQRCTTAGTATAVTPQSLDPGDSIASTVVGGTNHTVDPTLTSNALPLSIPLNGRATFPWYANPGSEIMCAATASNGLAIRTPTMTAQAVTATAHFDEL